MDRIGNDVSKQYIDIIKSLYDRRNDLFYDNTHIFTKNYLRSVDNLKFYSRFSNPFVGDFKKTLTKSIRVVQVAINNKHIKPEQISFIEEILEQLDSIHIMMKLMEA